MQALKQNWHKLGNILYPQSDISWMNSHAAACWAELIDENRLRIVIGGRSTENISRIGFLDYDLKSGQSFCKNDNLLLDIGESGCFDERGVSYPWIVDYKGLRYLYYTGWKLGGIGGFINDLGLAISDDGGKTYKRYSTNPIFPQTADEAYGIGSMAVIAPNATHAKWQIYYTCFRDWIKSDNKYEPKYHIRYAESDDGINWARASQIVIDFLGESEHAICKPMPIYENNIYKLYYSYRSLGSGYKIGYAESANGVNFTRADELVNFDNLHSAWDNEMMEYGFVFDSNMNRYMLYNGNGYGKTGLGLAVLKHE